MDHASCSAKTIEGLLLRHSYKASMQKRIICLPLYKVTPFIRQLVEILLVPKTVPVKFLLVPKMVPVEILLVLNMEQ